MSQTNLSEKNSKTISQRENESNDNHSQSENQLISQLYHLLLSNELVKTGKSQLSKVSEPLLAKYKVLREESLNKIQERSQEMIGEGKDILKNLFYSPTIYNHLVGAWLIRNTPYDGKIYSYEEYLETLKSFRGANPQAHIDDKYTSNFYEHARLLWTSMVDPSNEDVKYKCMLIAAQAIAKDNGVKDAEFEKKLVDIFQFITADKKHVPSFETYLALLVARSSVTSDAEVNQFAGAANTFFTFAKRFVFLEFPSTYSNQNLLQFLLQFTKAKADVSAELVLIRLDRVLTSLINMFHAVYEDKEDPINLLDRINTIVLKAKTLTMHVSGKSVKAVQDSGSYKVVDSYIDFEQRYREFRGLLQVVYDYSETKFIDPTKEAVLYVYDKVTNEYLVVMKDVSEDFIKEQKQRLLNRYTFLKDASLSLKDKVLEVRLDKEVLNKYKGNLKEQILIFYEEVRNLDVNKIKIYGSKVYLKALENIKKNGSHEKDGHEENSDTKAEENPSAESKSEESKPQESELEKAKDAEPEHQNEEHKQNHEEQASATTNAPSQDENNDGSRVVQDENVNNQTSGVEISEDKDEENQTNGESNKSKKRKNKKNAK